MILLASVFVVWEGVSGLFLGGVDSGIRIRGFSSFSDGFGGMILWEWQWIFSGLSCSSPG